MNLDWAWVLQVVGLAGGFALALHLWRSLGEPVETAIHLLIPGAALIFIGGKLLFWMERGRTARSGDLLDPGYSGFGALVLVVGFWLALSHIHSFPVLRFFDAVAPAAALGLFFGRLACFLRGCCGGTPTDLPWAVRFPPGSVLYSRQVGEGLIPRGSSASLPVHPTQLYEAIFALGACLLLWRMIGRKNHRDGDVFFAGMLGYGVFRFAVETVRADAAAGPTLWGLTPAQGFSLFLVALATLFLYQLRRSRRVSGE